MLCSGQNPRQVKAIADGVEEALRAAKIRPAHVEGYERAEWVLMDYFYFIVHVFSPQTREFYALERLWGDAERIEISDESEACRTDAQRSSRVRCCAALADGARCAVLLAPVVRGVRRAARRAHARARLPPLLGRRSSRSRLRSAQRCGDPLPSWRIDQPRRRPLPALPAARLPPSRVRARSAPTRARCARSCTR